jgi:hypothetical protein
LKLPSLLFTISPGLKLNRPVRNMHTNAPIQMRPEKGCTSSMKFILKYVREACTHHEEDLIGKDL